MIKIFITYFLLTGIWSIFYTRKHYDRLIKLKPHAFPKDVFIIGSFFIGFMSFPITIPLNIFYKIKNIFNRRSKLETHQHTLITSIAKELNIPKAEVLFLFIEFGNMMMIATQDEKELEESMQKKFGHLKEYKHWKEIAKIVYESFHAYQKNHPNEK